ncbi:CoxG family protein [Halomarina pelagica]|uniref:CoxG family protein n=1 Tax=Halomarina pelagica TaxID=2961599 RepID=UPI0020C41D8B|nr:SRPBCC family protein [Halomarina sp. BND7]
MTVRVERTIELDAPPEDVWDFISDPEKRARPISVVTDFETTGERTATWYVELPIPLVKRTIAVETRETTVDPPRYVRFVGRSKVMRVVGEHELEPTDGGTRLTNRFVVDGKLPGVERFFKRNLDAELDNLEAAIREQV